MATSELPLASTENSRISELKIIITKFYMINILPIRVVSLTILYLKFNFKEISFIWTIPSIIFSTLLKHHHEPAFSFKSI